jgi:DNA mismatch repair protein MutL
VKEPEKPSASVQPAREEPEAAAEEPVEPEQMNFAPADGPEPLRYVGEVFRTYILAERGDELCLIDKHAAHERQLYEKLAANYGNVPSQMLLEPAAIDLAAEEKQALLDNIPLLENAGLEIADFGGNTVVLRAVPADVEPQNAESLLVEIANKLLKGGHDALNEHTEWVLAAGTAGAGRKDPFRRGAAVLPAWPPLRTQIDPEGAGKAVWTHRINIPWWPSSALPQPGRQRWA